ncbi:MULTISPECIES: DUF397 domain-containing protein [unclassified Streptomyces]|uniref:DUF397 domain-containing protein n=1 Tax=unclassified Streptomyces TaxID=2593676 RepID=UPI0036EDB417
MPDLTWQKSSYCAQGDSCVHVATAAGAVHLTESADPSRAILTATPAAFAALVRRVRVTDQKQIGWLG